LLARDRACHYGRPSMNNKTRKGGRPPDQNAKKHAIMVRLDDADWARFERLVESRNEDLQAENIKVKGPDVIRWLIAREFASRGFDAMNEQKITK
jgi:hypothetical protein